MSLPTKPKQVNGVYVHGNDCDCGICSTPVSTRYVQLGFSILDPSPTSADTVERPLPTTTTPGYKPLHQLKVSLSRRRPMDLEGLEEDEQYVDRVAYLEEQEEALWETYKPLDAVAETLSKQKASKQRIDAARLKARKVLGAHDKILGSIGLAHSRHIDYLQGRG